MNKMQVNLICSREGLLPYVDLVNKMADSDRVAFSFFPESFYLDTALSEKMIVATLPSDHTYIGHLIFGGVFPNGRVYQIFIAPQFRSQGFARVLFEKLFEILNNRQYAQVQARVATDLVDANKLYKQMGFKIRKIVNGGKTTGRKINIRVKDLSAPTLFTYIPTPMISEDFNIPERTTARSPTFVIDLNVIFDAVKNRLNSNAAGILIQAAFKNYIRVAISRELKNELERTAFDVRTDPMLSLTSNIWTLEVPPKVRIKEISDTLASVVFPERQTQGKLTVQDKSDLVHLITAIENRVAGFVTSEKKILAASNYFRLEFGLEIISLSELTELINDDDNSIMDIPDAGMFSDNCTTLFSTDFRNPTIQTAVKELNINARFLPAAILSPTNDHQFVVVYDSDKRPVGISWRTISIGPTPITDAFIWVDSSSLFKEGIIDFLCQNIIHESCSRDVGLVKLLSDQKQTSLRESLLEHGFKASSGNHHDESVLQKVCVGYPIHRENWQKVRLKISNVAGGITLPKALPSKSGHSSLIEFDGHDGTTRNITHQSFEHLLSPTLLISEDRDGVIVPITRLWADDLFGTHNQGGLFTPPEAIERRERVYFSKPASIKALRPGKVILFYESGSVSLGRKAIIAIGRITQSNVVRVNEMEDNLLKRGVIDKRTLQANVNSGKQTVTFFDNIMTLRYPVPYKRLMDLGCDNGLNFVTATPVSAKNLEIILIEGQAHA